MLSIAIDRASLALAALVIADDPSTGLWVSEDGLQRPGKQWDRTYADAPWVNGSVLTSATLQQTSLPFTLYAQAATTAALRALQDEVDEALSQFAYAVTLTVDGDTDTRAAEPADISWGAVDSGMVRAKIATATITIPVYPVSA